MSTPPPVRHRVPQCTAALVLAWTMATAGATDLVSANPPVELTDLTAQVAQRRLHLPPGHWVLVGREEVETAGPRQHRASASGTGIEAWLVQEQAGKVRAVLHLSLPLKDFARERPPAGTHCPRDDGIQRLDLSADSTLPECLGVYGHHDLREALATRARSVARWMDRSGIADPGAVVRFVYRLRTDDTYAGITLFLPTLHFEADQAAALWANELRTACRPLFEGREQDATLPSPPAIDDDAK